MLNTYYLLFHCPTGLYESLDTYYGYLYNAVVAKLHIDTTVVSSTLLIFQSYEDAYDTLSAWCNYDKTIVNEVYEIHEKQATSVQELHRLCPDNHKLRYYGLRD